MCPSHHLVNTTTQQHMDTLTHHNPCRLGDVERRVVGSPMTQSLERETISQATQRQTQRFRVEAAVVTCRILTLWASTRRMPQIRTRSRTLWVTTRVAATITFKMTGRPGSLSGSRVPRRSPWRRGRAGSRVGRHPLGP